MASTLLMIYAHRVGGFNEKRSPLNKILNFIGIVYIEKSRLIIKSITILPQMCLIYIIYIICII